MRDALRRLRARRRALAGFAHSENWPERAVLAPGGVPVALEGVKAVRWETTHELVGDAIDVEPLARALALAPAAAVVTSDAVIDGFPVLRPGPSPERDAVVDPTPGATLVRRDLAADPWQAVIQHGRTHVALPLGVRSTKPGSGLHNRGQVHEKGVRSRNPNPPLAGEPSVEIIVPFRDRPELLKRLLPTLRATAWERTHVTLVDNGSTDPAVADVARGWEVRHDPRPFNFSALNNAAAAQSSADVLVFLNSDTELPDPDWLETLLAHATQPEIGAVGPLLVTPEGRVQHAGVAVGIHRTAGHPFAGLWPDAPTAFGSATDGPRNWLAVTAACLVVERSKFPRFDEDFAIAGQDVDLGLRLTAQGLRNLVVPSVRVIHDESSTRAAQEDLDPDVRYSRDRYEPYLSAGDPYYHPALTLDRTDCSFRD